MSIELRRAFEVFCLTARAERLVQLVDAGSPKTHKKLTSMLAHGFEVSLFRPAYATPYDNARDARAHVLRVARLLQLSGDCDVLSENRDLDGSRMPFTELFDAANASGFGTFAVLDPERLAFFQGEAPHSTVVLHKP